MNSAVFTFSKPSPKSKLASARIASFVAAQLRLPLHWTDSIAAEPLETLIIVNGAFAFCNYLEAVGLAVEQAERVIWVQNDYTIVPPKTDSTAESPFRAAFARRAAAGLPHYDLWTTIDPAPAYAQGAHNAYVNWNALTYTEAKFLNYKAAPNAELLYYGAYRQNREEEFKRYIAQAAVPTVVRTSSIDKFSALCVVNPLVRVDASIAEENLLPTLAKSKLGLYIEDKKSHTEFHSPANRFYEMLSVNLPMVFQPESVKNLARAGYDVSKFVVNDAADVAAAMLRSADIARQQHAWREKAGEDLKELITALPKLWKAHKRRGA